MKWNRYKSGSIYSYALGTYPTLELIKHYGHTIQEIVLSDNAGGTGVEKIKASGYPISISSKQLNLFSQRGDIHVAGIFRPDRHNLNPVKNHVLLYAPDDAGNLGSIMRTMLAFGFKDLALIGSQLEWYNPKAVRASMGACFSLRISSFPSLDVYRTSFNHGMYTFAADGTVKLSALHPQPPFSFLFGNEGEGLPVELIKVQPSIRIDQSEEVDSLNLATSVGIALYQFRNLG